MASSRRPSRPASCGRRPEGRHQAPATAGLVASLEAAARGGGRPGLPPQPASHQAATSPPVAAWCRLGATGHHHGPPAWPGRRPGPCQAGPWRLATGAWARHRAPSGLGQRARRAYRGRPRPQVCQPARGLACPCLRHRAGRPLCPRPRASRSYGRAGWARLPCWPAAPGQQGMPPPPMPAVRGGEPGGSRAGSAGCLYRLASCSHAGPGSSPYVPYGLGPGHWRGRPLAYASGAGCRAARTPRAGPPPVAELQAWPCPPRARCGSTGGRRSRHRGYRQPPCAGVPVHGG